MRRAWIGRSFAAGVVLFFVATGLVVILQRSLVTWGPFSTLGLQPLVYLLSIWCLTASLLGLLFTRETTIARVAGAVAGLMVGIVVAGVSILLGATSYSAASTPLYRIALGQGDADYLVRVGDPFTRDGLSLYLDTGRSFELVDHVIQGVDVERFESEHRVDVSADGTPVLVYPTGNGGTAQIDLSAQKVSAG